MTLISDLRDAQRMWRMHPLLAAAAVVSLALGIGANTAIFSVLETVLFRSAPVRDPRTLLAVYSTSTANPGGHRTSFKNFEDLRDALPFDLLAYASVQVGFASGAHPAEQVQAELVSGNYFALLGVPAALGRPFAFRRDEDKIADKHPVVVISDAFWKRHFGGAPDVVNRTVHVNARPLTVVGVAPPGFVGLDVMRSVDLWIPSLDASVLTGVDAFYLRQRAVGMFDVIARVEPPLQPPRVRSMLEARAVALARSFPHENTGLGFATRPFWQSRMSPAARENWVKAGTLLVVVVSLVLLIACANVANLLLARSTSRARELALRLAIGATPRQLTRLLLLEGSFLSAAGALVGLAIAFGSLRMLSALRPSFLPASFHAGLDGTAIAFTALVALAIGPVCGLLPGIQASRTDPVVGLTGRAGRRGAPRSRFGLALLVSQSAFATVALILAVLFVRSFWSARKIDPGFDSKHVAVLGFDLGMLRYDNKRGPELVRRINERVREIPGVVASAVASHVLLDGAGLASKIRLAGREDAEALSVEAGAVGLDYFRTMGISVLEGRSFRESDAAEVSAFGWAVVNRTMADSLWPGRSAVGQRIHVLSFPEPYVVVGVVSDSRYENLGESRRPYFYIYYDQAPGIKKLTLHVRTAGEPRLLLGAIQRAIREVDPNLPLIDVRTMSDVLKRSIWIPRTGAALLALFGIVAFTLAMVGTYGVTSFAVGQRRREIAIRLALGATPYHVISMVARRALIPAAAGAALGLVGSSVGTRLVTSLLVGVPPTDAKTFAVVAVVLTASAGAASLLPSVNAVRRGPAGVLRRH